MAMSKFDAKEFILLYGDRIGAGIAGFLALLLLIYACLGGGGDVSADDIKRSSNSAKEQIARSQADPDEIKPFRRTGAEILQPGDTGNAEHADSGLFRPPPGRARVFNVRFRGAAVPSCAAGRARVQPESVADLDDSDVQRVQRRAYRFRVFGCELKMNRVTSVSKGCIENLDWLFDHDPAEPPFSPAEFR